MLNLQTWAARWQVPPAALLELAAVCTAAAPLLPPVKPTPKSEADIVDLARLNASKAGARVWRNNSGALTDRDGRVVRYGLANDSKRVNDTLKSSDLIGLRPIVITPLHFGRTIGQFVALECKAPGWKFSESDKRAVAQRKFLTVVQALGGHARFTCDGSVT